MHPFRRLAVWQKGHELALATYRATEGVSYRRFPGLADQLRRAVCSIPANVAEGSGRDTPEQFAHFLEIAIGSAREVDYLLQLAADLEAIARSDHAKLEARNDQVCRMLVALRATIRERALSKRTRTRTRATQPREQAEGDGGRKVSRTLASRPVSATPSR